MLYVPLRILLFTAATALAAAILASCASTPPAATEPNAEAAKFFKGKPRRVTVPAELMGKPNDQYEVRKTTVNLRGRPVKVLYTVTRTGQIGEMYDDGTLGGSDTGSDTGSGTAAMTRPQFLKKAEACGNNFNCFLALVDEAMGDCRRTETAEDCWMCKQVSGNLQDEDCSFL